MNKYLIDANLPVKITVWRGSNFKFVSLIDQELTDSQLWEYAKDRNLIIVSKDADFSDRAIVDPAPPKLVHIKIGNLRLQDFARAIERLWPRIDKAVETCKILNVFIDRIECID